MIFLTKAQLETLNTNRLLSLFKAMRDQMYTVYGRHHPETGVYCPPTFYVGTRDGKQLWAVHPEKEAEYQAELKAITDYVELIKSVLNTREHVDRKQITTHIPTHIPTFCRYSEQMRPSDR